jgi:hypothetical protein
VRGGGQERPPISSNAFQRFITQTPACSLKQRLPSHTNLHLMLSLPSTITNTYKPNTLFSPQFNLFSSSFSFSFKPCLLLIFFFFFSFSYHHVFLCMYVMLAISNLSKRRTQNKSTILARLVFEHASSFYYISCSYNYGKKIHLRPMIFHHFCDHTLKLSTSFFFFKKKKNVNLELSSFKSLQHQLFRLNSTLNCNGRSEFTFKFKVFCNFIKHLIRYLEISLINHIMI